MTAVIVDATHLRSKTTDRLPGPGTATCYAPFTPYSQTKRLHTGKQAGHHGSLAQILIHDEVRAYAATKTSCRDPRTGLDWTAAAPTPRSEVHASSHLDAQPEPSGPTDEPQTRDEPVI